jgi:hypothetical protein
MTRSARTIDRFIGGCVGWIAARDPRARFVGGQMGYAEPVHSRFVGGQVGWITTAVTPASRYVGGVVGYVS